MNQPSERLRFRHRPMSGRCQFGSCQRSGKARSISYYDHHGKLLTLHPRVCDPHYRDLPYVDGVVTVWLNNLRGLSN
jgi:hypothetical protein